MPATRSARASETEAGALPARQGPRFSHFYSGRSGAFDVSRSDMEDLTEELFKEDAETDTPDEKAADDISNGQRSGAAPKLTDKKSHGTLMQGLLQMQEEAGSEPEFDSHEQPDVTSIQLDQDKTPAPKGQRSLLQTFDDDTVDDAPVERDAAELTGVTDNTGRKGVSLGTMRRVDVENKNGTDTDKIDAKSTGGVTFNNADGARVRAEPTQLRPDDPTQVEDIVENIENNAGYDLKEYWGDKDARYDLEEYWDEKNDKGSKA